MNTQLNYPRLSIRLNYNNPDHHLWNNNGTVYIDFTVHPTPNTKLRIRQSLHTDDMQIARIRRDAVLEQLMKGIFPEEVYDFIRQGSSAASCIP
jgi:hypothetical protein